MSQILRAQGIHKSYRIGKQDIPVLRGIDMSVMEGEIVALCGSSGAGKSTLLHVLGLLDPPTAGKVWYRDQCATDISAARQARLRHDLVGFVFQFYHLIAELSALENVMLGEMMLRSLPEYLRRRKQIKARAADLLTSIGLGDRLKNRPSQLSGGERQRVAIARALVSDPQVILADEPTGNLDSKSGDEIMELLLQLNRDRSTTLVIVTHDPEIAGLTRRVIHIRDGHLAEE